MLDADLRARVAAADLARIDVAAEAEGLSRAGWTRRAILAALPPGSEVGSLPRSPRRRPSIVPSEDIEAIATLVGHLGRATGAAVQIAKASREAGFRSLHAEAEAAVADLRRATAAAVALLDRLAPSGV